MLIWIFDNKNPQAEELIKLTKDERLELKENDILDRQFDHLINKNHTTELESQLQDDIAQVQGDKTSPNTDIRLPPENMADPPVIPHKGVSPATYQDSTKPTNDDLPANNRVFNNVTTDDVMPSYFNLSVKNMIPQYDQYIEVRTLQI